MKILAVCRGAPGLGRVAPSLALAQTLRGADPASRALFATYAAGYAYLRAIGEDVIDLGAPDGLFIDSVAPQALHVLDLAERHAPDVVLVDGEFLLLPTLAHLRVPVVYLANPHDLIGPTNAFRRVNRLLLAHAAGIIISSLGCRRAHPLTDLVPGVGCIEVPPLVKSFPSGHGRPTGRLRVLVSTGGGSIGADPRFREATDAALRRVLAVLADRYAAGRIAAATVVLGADATPPLRPWPDWLTVIAQPIELTGQYTHHDVFVARAGRNTCAEAIYAGIPTVALPITADQHRGGEQRSNAEIARLAHTVIPVPDWRSGPFLGRALDDACDLAGHAERRTGVRGNDDAARFVANLVATIGDPHTLQHT